MNSNAIEHVNYQYDTQDETYELLTTIKYWSTRYKKSITVPTGFHSDGATHATDIASQSWWIHDWLCHTHTFDDGSPASAWQASRIMGDILTAEGFYIEACTWVVATWLWTVWQWS